MYVDDELGIRIVVRDLRLESSTAGNCENLDSGAQSVADAMLLPGCS